MYVPFGPPALPAPPNSFTFGLATVPQARGAVRVAGPDPSAQPLIDPNYLGAEHDVLRLVDAVAVAREIAAAHPFDAWRGKELHPGPDARDQQRVREFVTRATGTYFHPVDTCAMGTGPDAVVDLDLRLRGVRGLRVADASVMPRIVCQHQRGHDHDRRKSRRPRPRLRGGRFGVLTLSPRSVVHRERHDAGSRHGALLAVGNCLHHAVDVK
ncbi:GMC oxidoreductase [Amycolatopsis sp. NPDC050768]|uniref:GMC oxidoreductase n=1 Tax=Amycolatopsis sp. NPDC050768 TaxID=3154839 RepID=UPI0033D88FD9